MDLGKKYGLNVNPAEKVSDVPVGTKQKVEILKALMRGSDILVLDEPTAVLTPQETSELFVALKSLREMGHTIIFISHKLREVKHLSDRVTVMRSGRVVGTVETAKVTLEDISKMMVGRDVELKLSRPRISPDRSQEVRLLVRNLKYVQEDKEVLKGVSLKVRSGEILGIAGVEGNGQVELVEVLTGLSTCNDGEVEICGQKAAEKNPEAVRNLGLSHIPQDRMTFGVASRSSISENLISTRYKKEPVKNGPFLNLKAISDLSHELIQRFEIKATSPQQPVSTLQVATSRRLLWPESFRPIPK